MILGDKVKHTALRQTGVTHFIDRIIAVVIILIVVIINAVAEGGLAVRVAVLVHILKAGELNRNDVTHLRPP